VQLATAGNVRFANNPIEVARRALGLATTLDRWLCGLATSIAIVVAHRVHHPLLSTLSRFGGAHECLPHGTCHLDLFVLVSLLVRNSPSQGAVLSGFLLPLREIEGIAVAGLMLHYSG
jgi:hypothetical protein